MKMPMSLRPQWRNLYSMKEIGLDLSTALEVTERLVEVTERTSRLSLL